MENTTMSSPLNDVEEFFWHVVYDYNCSDVQKLLDVRLNACGPLLASTLGGIDVLGGMMLGFAVGSQRRSIAFMEKHMGLDLEIAAMIYSLFHCGLFHEGVPKMETLFFVAYDLPQGPLLYGDPMLLILDVVQLSVARSD